MKMQIKPAVILMFAMIAGVAMFSCKKEKDEPATNTSSGSSSGQSGNLVLKFLFDSTQARLDNLGNPSSLPAGNSGQHPSFNKMSAHYIELAPSELTQLGGGEVIYQSPETFAGGDTAIDFSQSILVGEGETFLSIPLKNITPGTYDYLRVSLSYQNYDIVFRVAGTDYAGTIASFIGSNTYIANYAIKDSIVTVNENKLQGYWGFESIWSVITGQAPPGATTVPNPISGTSPIPPGSCVVTGPFASPLNISGNEKTDIVITMSLSTNNSFEWKDDDLDGYYEPTEGDTVVDMGIRGLVPLIN